MFEQFAKYMREAFNLTKTNDLETLLKTAERRHAGIGMGLIPAEPLLEGGFRLFINRTFPHLHFSGFGKGEASEPYSFQQELADTIDTNRVTLISHARQMGITTISSLYAAYSALSMPHQRVAFVSHSYVAAIEVAQKLTHFLSGFTTVEFNKSRGLLRLGCQSEIYFYSYHSYRNHLRGEQNLFSGNYHHYDTVVMDCASYCAFAWTDEIMNYVRMFRNTKFIVASTPRMGSLLNNLMRSDLLAARVHLPWSMNPRYDDELIKLYKNTLGEKQFAEEMECRLIEIENENDPK